MTLIQVQPVNVECTNPEGMIDVEKDVKGVFNPVSIYLRISGFYLGRHPVKFIRCIELINCVITKMILILNVIRYSTIFRTDNEIGSSLMGSISLFLLYSLAAVVSIVINGPLYTHWHVFVDKLTFYIKEHGDSTYLSKIKSRVRIFVLLGIVTDIAYLLIMSEGIESVFPSIKRHLTPFQHTTGSTKVVVLIFYAMLLLTVGMTLVSTFVVFVLMTFCLCKEYDALNAAFRTNLEAGEKNFETRFDLLRSRHEALSGVTETANKIQRHFAALVYGFGTPIVCCLLYGIIIRSLPVDDAVFNSWNLATVSFYMAAVTGMGSALNSKAHEPMESIFRSNWSLFRMSTVQKLNLFVSRLSAEKIGYSVYGLFTIERSTVLMVCGTILTYAVVVLQFQPSGSGNCVSLEAINLTQLCASNAVCP